VKHVRPCGLDAPAEVDAPDLIDPIVGWRLWRIAYRRRHVRLSSLFLDDLWPWLDPLEARCAVPRIPWWRAPPRHTAPHEDCDCGIYATRWEIVASQLLHHEALPKSLTYVAGEVALWGTVVECESGWRSTYAYPQRIFALVPRRVRELEVSRVVNGLERYGVPVEPVELSDAAAAIEAQVVMP
jgi:hypothetical protein